MVWQANIADPCAHASVLVTEFLSDGVEEIMDYNGRTGTLIRDYMHGPGIDELITWRDWGGNGLFHHYAADQLGSIIAIQARNGAIEETYSYSAYGEVNDATGNPFRYTGRRLDAETGLYYYRARYYSAALGRFLQTDPIGYGDQMNLYAYVGNDPVNRWDPSGEAEDDFSQQRNLESRVSRAAENIGRSDISSVKSGSLKEPTVDAIETALVVSSALIGGPGLGALTKAGPSARSAAITLGAGETTATVTAVTAEVTVDIGGDVILESIINGATKNLAKPTSGTINQVGTATPNAPNAVDPATVDLPRNATLKMRIAFFAARIGQLVHNIFVR